MKFHAILVAEVRRDVYTTCRHTCHAGGRIAIQNGAVVPAELHNDVRDRVAICRA